MTPTIEDLQRMMALLDEKQVPTAGRRMRWIDEEGLLHERDLDTGAEIVYEEGVEDDPRPQS